MSNGVTNPSGSAPAMQSAGGLSDLFKDRSFLQFLAQAGTEFDPKGIGGMLGRPTSQYIERESTESTMNQLMQALGGNNNLTGVDVKPDGTISMKGAAGQAPAPGEAAPTAETQPQAERGSAPAAEPGVQPDTFESVIDRLLGQFFPDLGGE